MIKSTIKNASITTGLLLSLTASAADWDNIPMPVEAGAGKTWELQESYSDSFNYTGKSSTFLSKWKDQYFHGWTGPGLTYWHSDESWVSDGNLIISASRRQGTNQVNAGVVTSKTKVKYPIYLEANIKVSNLELSSNFWLLSENDQREIDVLEVYGGAEDEWFAKNQSTNFHVFERNADNTIKNDFNDQSHNTPSWGTYWRDGFHRFAVYWKSPTEVTFYIDGQQTPDGSWAQSVMKDKDYTGQIMDKNKYTMDQEAFIILDTEDHSWRSEAGIIASDDDLADGNKNKMYVDWIRVYKPVADGSENGNDDSTADVPTGVNTLQVKHSGKCFDVAGGAMYNGSKYHQWTCNANNVNQQFKMTSLGQGEYAIASERSGLCVELKDGSSANGAAVQQWVCNHADDSQRWIFNDKGDGYYEIRSKASNKCLDVSGISQNNGATIYQWNCNNANNQRFKFL